jgi:uncharacterized protein
MDPNALLAGRSRETRIRRDAEGRWFDGDDPIDHPGISRAFDRWIDLADDGRYCLKNEVNWAYVSVEGAPVFVRRVVSDGEALRLELSDTRTERLDPSTLRQAKDGALYCSVRGGRLAARFDRSAAFQLGDLGKEDEQGAYLEIEGAKWRPPITDDPLRFGLGGRLAPKH